MMTKPMKPFRNAMGLGILTYALKAAQPVAVAILTAACVTAQVETLPTPPQQLLLTVVTWNMNAGRGNLPALVTDVEEGRLSGGSAPREIVLLLQEVYRAQILAFARRHQLHVIYAPARRQDGEDDDRGSAVLSTPHPDDILVVELPYEKHRRIAVGATLTLRRRLSLMDLDRLTSEPAAVIGIGDRGTLPIHCLLRRDLRVFGEQLSFRLGGKTYSGRGNGARIEGGIEGGGAWTAKRAK